MAATGQESSSREIRVLVDGKPATLTLTREGVIQSSQQPSFQQTNVYNVLWAEVSGDQLELSYIKRRKKGKQSLLTRSYWRVDEADKDAAKQWCEAVMAAAYQGVTPKRRLRIFVNPHGGPGKARQIYSTTVEPIFQAARCLYETSFTERAKHATELAKQLSLEFDALVLLSGDGLLHEVYNGFAEHEDPITAFSISVAPIPTGSANGMAVNLLGIEDGFDVAIACLNAVKGKPMKQDICSAMLGDKRVFSYFSVSLGLMADLDLGTEHLRWMGDVRFVLGYLYGALKMRSCPITLEMKTAESDKDKMIEEFRKRSEAHWRAQHAQELEGHRHSIGDDSLPKLKHVDSLLKGNADEGWVKFDKPLVYFYAGSSPYVGRDLMQFPMAHASDGLIDIVVQEPTSRLQMLKAMDGAEKGKTFFIESQHYFKAHAFRITPHTADGNLAIDGERYSLQPFTVECHRALGTLLSPTGHYYTEFDTSPYEQRKRNSSSRQTNENQEAGYDDDATVKRKGLSRLLVCC